MLNAEDRNRYLDKIRAVIEEFGYTGTIGQTRQLLEILNGRRLWNPDFRRVSLEEAMQYARPWELSQEIRWFLKNYLPAEYYSTMQERRKRRYRNHSSVTNRLDTPRRLDTPSERTQRSLVEHGAESTGTRRITGWTVRADKRGFYRAYRKINGRTRSIYLGRSLDGAETKIRAWEESQAGSYD